MIQNPKQDNINRQTIMKTDLTICIFQFFWYFEIYIYIYRVPHKKVLFSF